MLDSMMLATASNNMPYDYTPGQPANYNSSYNSNGNGTERERVDLCIKALIKAQGKIKLAVEDLNAEDPTLEITVEEYALLLIRNKTALYEAVQAISLLHTFDNFVFASTLMKSALGEMPAADVGKTYTAMLSAIKEVTSPKTIGGLQLNNTQNNFNLEQKIMEELPPHVVQALQIVKAAGNNVPLLEGEAQGSRNGRTPLDDGASGVRNGVSDSAPALIEYFTSVPQDDSFDADGSPMVDGDSDE